MAYCDQLAQFNSNQTAEVDYFVIANTPKRYWGLLIVGIVLLLHCYNEFCAREPVLHAGQYPARAISSRYR